MITIGTRQHFLDKMTPAEYAAEPFKTAWHWYYLSTVAVMHACIMMLVNIFACWVSPRRRWWACVLKVIVSRRRRRRRRRRCGPSNTPRPTSGSH